MATITKVTGKKGTTYRVRIRLRGQPTASANFERKTDAKKWAIQTEAKIREGRYFKTQKAMKYTVQELIDKYADEDLPNIKSESDYTTHLDWWKDEIGDLRVGDVDSDTLLDCRTKLLDSGRSSSTTNRYLSTLRSAFSKVAISREWLETSPFSKIQALSEPDGRVRFLDDNERDALFEQAKGSRNKDLYLIVLLAVSTGMRQNEIMTLTWSQIDFERDVITLFETKNGSIRAVPLAGPARKILKRQSRVRLIDNNYIFVGRKKGKHMAFPRDAFARALERAGIEDFRFHDLRHTAASYLAMSGATLAEIAEILGHKTLQMVKRYAHLTEQHTVKVAQRMTDKYLEGAG